MAETGLNIYQKLAKIRAIADVAKKDSKGYGYKYTSLEQILSKVTAGMKKYGVSLIPTIIPGTANVDQNVVVNTKVDKVDGSHYDSTSTEMLFTADMVYIWVNDDSPEDRIEVPWFVTGSQADPSQATGSGLSYCTRYFLTNYFQIAQTDTDVDAYRSKQKEAEASEDVAIAEEIIQNVDLMVKSYLSDHPDNRDAVLKFVSKFAKNGNYNAIKEPNLAAKLMTDFENKFLNKEEQ